MRWIFSEFWRLILLLFETLVYGGLYKGVNVHRGRGGIRCWGRFGRDDRNSCRLSWWREASGIIGWHFLETRGWRAVVYRRR